jgi:type VI secretion system protein ImpA
MSVNLDDYLKDIDPEQVSGEDLQYDPAFIELEQTIKGKPEQQMGDTLIEAEPPNWKEVKKQSEALLTRSIDLRVLVCYLRALMALEAFPGLGDGLVLMATLTELRWDSIHPQLDADDDNDPTERVNVLMSLCDYETMLRPVQQLPLLESKSLGRFNFRDISIASGKSTATSHEKDISQTTIDGAVQDSDIENLQQTFNAVSASLENLNKLEKVVTDYVGINDAPGFTELRVILKESKAFLADCLEKKGEGDENGTEGITEETSQSGGAVISSSTKSVAGVINNNQDVIKTLSLVCDYYKKNEPSSPVPLFVERAIRLVGKNFIDALKDIAPAGIDEARLVFGKKDEEDD